MILLGLVASSGASDAMQLISSTTLTTTSSTIDFSSIPSTFKHLQIRISSRSTDTNSPFYLTLNGDTGITYSRQIMDSTGSTTIAHTSASGNQTSFYAGFQAPSSAPANAFSSAVITLTDYKNTNTLTTMRSTYGLATSGGQYKIGMSGGVWNSLSAVNRVTFSGQVGGFAIGTTISLYGILG